mmetsp:Transcript_23996/g.32863  ORF Transcript_23996/g.32863 Transcript_23996/m.32863 type:complete len:437 (-) Transcript_23996:64-1374(-)
MTAVRFFLLFLVLTITTTLVSGELRKYFIAVEEELWDYAPTGVNQISGVPFSMDHDQGGDDGGHGGHSRRDMHDGGHNSHAAHTDAFWTVQTSTRIGRVYMKARYREYTDDSFVIPKEHLPEDSYLGLLGPVIRASVGDEIQVVFQNKANSRPYSIHPHGVRYNKPNEGSGYQDGSSHAGDSVAPGDTYIYNWSVPERSGPGPNDPSSILFLYHSHVDETSDTNSGLVGPIIITSKKKANMEAKPKDVDQEVILLMTVFNEAQSWYFMHNIQHFLNASGQLTEHHLQNSLLEDPDFRESNEMHSINGYVFGNLPNITIQQDSRVRWYVAAIGSEDDIHTLHWHSTTLLHHGNRVDSIDLLPGMMEQADMSADELGIWFMHCHVNHHIHGGMTGRFIVVEGDDHPHHSSGGPSLQNTKPLVMIIIGAFLSLWMKLYN